ncbi:hypothetical protein ACJRO7_033570 [Eucalyptus globulus]|uniref:Uncharacterized protein n=1 Tax=Eucalyptus globulus TaxID=34317 RepID=A0ABD3JQT3_EUCGL
MFAQNHIFSLAPKSHNPVEKSRDLEFEFEVPCRMRNHHSRNYPDLLTLKRNHHSRNYPDLLTLWKHGNMSVRVAKDVDTSPLLPLDHHYSNLSPLLTTQRIEEGRREMMEMIQNIPESSYELSFKNIVHEQLSLQSNKKQKRKKRKKVTKAASHQHHQVSRCNCMETRTFLIKIRSQISPRMLFEGPDQRNSDMVSRIKMSPLAKGQGSCDRDRTESSTSRSKGYSSSNNDGDSFLGRWPFARPEGEMRRQRTSCFLSSSAPCT